MGIRQFTAFQNPDAIAEESKRSLRSDTGIKLAQAITSSSILDFIELSKDCGIAEIHTPESWFGKTLRELNIRAKLGVNIIAIRHDGKIEVAPGADFALKENTVLVVLGTNDKLAKLKP